jgi:phosphotransferase system HPr (HPr) family protein
MSVTLERTVSVANPQGLHMRPCAAFAELAMKFQSDVVVQHNGQTANGKSIWDLLSLAAMPGGMLTVQTAGPDAREALEALAGLISQIPDKEN